jgi:hypothetical protein
MPLRPTQARSTTQARRWTSARNLTVIERDPATGRPLSSLPDIVVRLATGRTERWTSASAFRLHSKDRHTTRYRSCLDAAAPPRASGARRRCRCSSKSIPKTPTRTAPRGVIALVEARGRAGCGCVLKRGVT